MFGNILFFFGNWRKSLAILVLKFAGKFVIWWNAWKFYNYYSKLHFEGSRLPLQWFATDTSSSAIMWTNFFNATPKSMFLFITRSVSWQNFWCEWSQIDANGCELFFSRSQVHDCQTLFHGSFWIPKLDSRFSAQSDPLAAQSSARDPTAVTRCPEWPLLPPVLEAEVCPTVRPFGRFTWPSVQSRRQNLNVSQKKLLEENGPPSEKPQIPDLIVSQ